MDMPSATIRAGVAAIAVSVCVMAACNRSAPKPAEGKGSGESGETSERPENTTKNANGDSTANAARSTVDLEKVRPQVESFCGACHPVPNPQSFPARAWHDEVNQGVELYIDSGRSDLTVPIVRDVVDYFRAQAPQELTVDLMSKESVSDDRAWALRELTFTSDTFPAVSNLHWLSEGPAGPALFATDMQTGDVLRVTFDAGKPSAESIASANHPSHVTPTDLDADSAPDFLVGDLGTFEPGDHDLGRVVWLKPSDAEPGKYDLHVLADKLGRVADVRPADFDGDGDLDVVVGEFGWRNTGRILLLRCEGRNDKGIPKFDVETLDDRHGTIHTPVADLNGDGRPDFVALISQEHETIVAFLNDGDGGFDRQTIFAAGDPSFGSSGIELVDFDADGDLDVLYTNGDMMDDFFLKPYHAVHWLENRGEFPFVHHELAKIPGVASARAADLDDDGDLDIIAAAHIPIWLLSNRDDRRFESLIWFEQTKPGEFTRRRIELSADGLMTVATGDFDGDGSLEIAAGLFASPASPEVPWLKVWRRNK